jgi:multiple sugar transport system permease protein
MTRAWKTAALAAIIAVLILLLMPYLWIFLASFKTRLDALADVPVWIFTPTFNHYPDVFIDKNFLPLLWNSIIVASFSTALSLMVGVPAAYVFARYDFRAKEDLFFFFLTTGRPRTIPPADIGILSSSRSIVARASMRPTTNQRPAVNG